MSPRAAVIEWVLWLKSTPGRCRWCGCTEERACEGGCSWVNRAQTVCSSCAYVDRLMRSAHGRREIASKFMPED